MAVYVHICVDKGPGLQYFVVSPSPVPCTLLSLSLSLSLSVSLCVCASKQASSPGLAANVVFCFAHPELDWQGSILVELLWIVSTFHFQQSKNKKLDHMLLAAGNIILTWSNCSSCCSLQNTARLLFNSFVLIPCPFWFGLVWFGFFFCLFHSFLN